MLMKIDNVNREHVCRLLHCLTVATRPIRIEELAEVLATDIGDEGGISKLNADRQPVHQEQVIRLYHLA